jgi:Mg2+/Co2+ transporter CorB
LSNTPVGVLVGALIFFILLSGFFSAAEISLMTLNRYRLRSQAEAGHRGAKLALRLLERPDRLLGIILLGNNFANIAASSAATLIALDVYGENAIAAAAFALTFVILIFAEVAPKTFAALKPEKVGMPAAYILRPLLTIFYPAVWLVNLLSNLLLRLFGLSTQKRPAAEVSAEELRTIVREADVLIPASHQDMMLAILDLEKITVEDVMVPRNRIVGVNLDAEWNEIASTLASSAYTRMPAYRGSLDNVVGVIHARRVLNLLHSGRLDRDSLQAAILEPYFIPVGTTLTTQLLNFKQVRRRMGLVVDEYGDLQGLVTLDEILEEIVGDFTTRALGRVTEDVHPEADGSYLVRGGTSLRDLNRRLRWDLPTDESRTLNGLILEYLEDIPEPGTSLQLNGYTIEIVRTRGTAVDVARIRPSANPAPTETPEPPT